METFIRDRETGSRKRVRALNAQKRIVTQLTSSMELSVHVSAKPSCSGAVFSMDIERQEERYLLAGSSDGSLCIVDLDSDLCGTPTTTHESIARCDRQSANVNGNANVAHKFMITTCQWYAHDSGMFSTSSTDRSLKIWDSNQLVVVDSMQFPDSLSCHHWSDATTRSPLIAVAAGTNQPHLVDVISGSKVHQLRAAHSSPVHVVRWMPGQANLLVSGGRDGKVVLWDIRHSRQCLAKFERSRHKQGRRTYRIRPCLPAHNNAVVALQFSSDGQFLYSIGNDEHFHVWSTYNQSFRAAHSVRCQSQTGGPTKSFIQFALLDQDCSRDGDTAFVPIGDDIEMVPLIRQSRRSNTPLPRRVLRGHYAAVNACVYRTRHLQLWSAGNDRQLLCWTPRLHQNLMFRHEMAGGEHKLSRLTQDEPWDD